MMNMTFICQINTSWWIINFNSTSFLHFYIIKFLAFTGLLKIRYFLKNTLDFKIVKDLRTLYIHVFFLWTVSLLYPLHKYLSINVAEIEAKPDYILDNSHLLLLAPPYLIFRSFHGPVVEVIYFCLKIWTLLCIINYVIWSIFSVLQTIYWQKATEPIFNAHVAQ